MLTKHDIEQMTDGQREILLAGMKLKEAQIIALFENADSACSSWAIALIKGEK